MCAAPKNNDFWKQRAKHGRDKIFADAEVLRQCAYAYFEWANKSPWQKSEAIKSGDRCGDIIQVPTQRPFTISGLCIFLGVSQSYWRNVKKTIRDDGFLAVIEHVEEIIYTQKFEGATVGAFNANIISRDLGLIDKKENKIDLENMSEDELDKIINVILKRS